MTYKITYELDPNKDDTQVLGDGLMAYAKLKKNQPPIEFFAYFVRDDNGKIRNRSQVFL